MRRSISVCVAVLLTSTGIVAHAGRADWTRVDADGGRTNVNRLEHRLGRSTVERLRLDWRRRIRPDRPYVWEDISPMLVSDSRVFALWSADASRDDLVALDEATGARLWRRRLGDDLEPVAVDRRAVYVAVEDKTDRAVALDVHDGTTLWATRHVRPFAADRRGTLLFAVQASDRGDRVVALETATGAVAWTSDLEPRVDGSQPLVSRGLVFVPARTRPRTIVAMHAEDGTPVWSVQTRGWLYAAAAGRVFTIEWLDTPPLGGAVVEALDLRDGAQLWSHRLPTQAWIRATTAKTVIVDRLVCEHRGCEGDAFGEHRGGVVALDAQTGTHRWSVLGNSWGGDPLWQTGAVANGLVFVYRVELGDAAFGALDPGTGRLLWSRSMGGPRVFASLDVVANGAVLGGTYWNGAISGMIVRYALPVAAR